MAFLSPYYIIKFLFHFWILSMIFQLGFVLIVIWMLIHLCDLAFEFCSSVWSFLPFIPNRVIFVFCYVNYFCISSKIVYSYGKKFLRVNNSVALLVNLCSDYSTNWAYFELHHFRTGWTGKRGIFQVCESCAS